MTDTHTHIYDVKAFPEGPDKVLFRAKEAGVDRFILPNVNVESAPQLIALHKASPHCTYVAAGLHPCDASENWREEIESIMNTFAVCKPVAIGEVGMDLYWDKSTLERQKEVFAAQIEIAKRRGLPLIIHCREALYETLEVLRKHGDDVPAVFHSFTGNAADVEAIRELGDYYFGINGVVTFKNAPELREALAHIGKERILLETDSPYLAPVPYRGRRNESAYIQSVAEEVAKCLGMEKAEIEEITDNNASEFFGI